MQNHRKLAVWQKAYALSVYIYGLARRIARLDRSSLASQTRRAAKSIHENIAEGCGRATNKDFAKFLTVAIASSSELEDHIQFARDVGLLPPNEAARLREQVVEIRRMLYGLLKRVNGQRGKK